MHLHGHNIIKEVICPMHEFWCFSFERFNGILGKRPTNNTSIEPQLLHQFLIDNASSSFQFPSEFDEDFSSLGITEVKDYWLSFRYHIQW